MALVDLVTKTAPPARENWDRPVSCPSYRSGSGSRRCEHYMPVGGCELLDRLTCAEWRDGGAAAAADPLPPSPATSAGIVTLELAEGWAPPAALTGASAAHAPGLGQTAATRDAAAAEPMLGLQPEDLASFKALGVEVCIHSPTLGDVWLVPAYTNARRKEITPEHAATLATIVRAFPGARATQWTLSKE